MRDLVAWVALLAGCASPTGPAGVHRPAWSDPSDTTVSQPDPTSAEDRLRAIAAATGHIVQDGQLTFASYDGCCDEGADCLGNNPGTPYGTYAVPPAPTEVPTAAPDVFAPWGGVPAGLYRDFRFRQDEALVLIGRLPPQAKYFGLRSYLDIRVDEDTGARDQVFASLGPSLNNLVVADERGVAPDALAGGEFIVVTTADRAVEDAVSGWLAEAGFDMANVHYDRMTYEVARFGVHPQADTFSVQWRIAVPSDPAAMDAYRQDPGAVVLRITPSAELAAVEPHPWPVLPPSGSGQTEAYLVGASRLLQLAILAHHSSLEASVEPVWLANVDTLTCIPECGIADIHDRFTAKGDYFTLAEDEFMVVYGPNHELTGKASYASFAFMNEANQYGFLDVDSAEMADSARFYLPNHPLAGDLYAYTVARSCAGHSEPCVEIPTDCPFPDLDTQMKLTIRAYLEPSTGSAPIASELLLDQMVRFRPAAG